VARRKRKRRKKRAPWLLVVGVGMLVAAGGFAAHDAARKSTGVEKAAAGVVAYSGYKKLVRAGKNSPVVLALVGGGALVILFGCVSMVKR